MAHRVFGSGGQGQMRQFEFTIHSPIHGDVFVVDLPEAAGYPMYVDSAWMDGLAVDFHFTGAPGDGRLYLCCGSREQRQEACDDFRESFGVDGCLVFGYEHVGKTVHVRVIW